ncbi:hypothetical protein WUBG_14002 [Wuchereria bancrofti]|uniref:Uncharacterized protein n=1 Tax=Wuchereria bancrofti TaxID=6293 RepID=J9EI88_WUCBA|nr:hypothetical protein WUBG_14002 [Wuchereria bancrofti]
MNIENPRNKIVLTSSSSICSNTNCITPMSIASNFNQGIDIPLIGAIRYLANTKNISLYWFRIYKAAVEYAAIDALVKTWNCNCLEQIAVNLGTSFNFFGHS